MSLTSFSSFSRPNLHSQIGFGYNSTMKHVATEHHTHCAYGGEELNDRNPATAEHVKCHSAGGPNTDANFLPVCQKHNGERASIPLPKFLASHPQAWQNIKQSILELNGIKEANFDGHKWAQNIAQTVERESGKSLNLHLGNEISSEDNSEIDNDFEEPTISRASSRNRSSEIEDNSEIDRTLTTRTGKKINVRMSEIEKEEKPEIDKTLTTRTGKKINVGQNKPINFFA